MGINRLSMGLQTHENAILHNIGRGHTWETFLDAFKTGARYFDNINADIIFGLPGQTLQSFDETLKRLIDLSPQHISAYALKLETGTPLQKRFNGVDEDTDREMYHLASRRLTDLGYIHYETSNFAKVGYECRHNMRYWTGKAYLGLGVAAYSYLKLGDGVRFGNVTSLDDYFRYIDEHKCPVTEEVFLTKPDQIIEYIMLHLRLKKGINFDNYRDRFNIDFKSEFAEAIDTAQRAELITADTDGIRPTLKGFDLQNALIGEFIKKL
jgi:oxygen-independent coproporphyrinogen-3 oxidase